MLKKILTIIGIAGSISIIAIMTLSNPSSAGPVGILGLFISLYLVVTSATTWVLYYGSHLISKLPLGQIRSSSASLSIQKSYYFASVLALGPVLLIGMQSVSGVGLYELGLVVLLVVLGCIYVSRKMT